jgi:hypothetical protein
MVCGHELISLIDLSQIHIAFNCHFPNFNYKQDCYKISGETPIHTKSSL